VTPETQAHLDKARLSIAKARAALAAAANEPAMVEESARSAYYAAFHAAQALIFERTGKSSKTHSGVHRQFHKLTRSEPSIPRPLRTFLNSSYDFKSVADYDTASAGKITLASAGAAIATAEQFLAAVTLLVPP
jgi:uncharacterized protein (UPF0332 family)